MRRRRVAALLQCVRVRAYARKGALTGVWKLIKDDSRRLSRVAPLEWREKEGEKSDEVFEDWERCRMSGWTGQMTCECEVMDGWTDGRMEKDIQRAN